MEILCTIQESGPPKSQKCDQTKFSSEAKEQSSLHPFYFVTKLILLLLLLINLTCLKFEIASQKYADAFR